MAMSNRPASLGLLGVRRPLAPMHAPWLLCRAIQTRKKVAMTNPLNPIETVQALVQQMRSALGHPDNTALADQALGVLAQMQSQPSDEREANLLGWLWQHEETGNMGFVDPWQVANGWQAANPRLRLIRPLYTALGPVKAQQEPVRPDLRQAVMDAIAQALGDAYDCLRVWEAWSYGTMGPDDFSLVAEDSDRLSEIADAAIAAHQGAQPAVQQEPQPDMVKIEADALSYAGLSCLGAVKQAYRYFRAQGKTEEDFDRCAMEALTKAVRHAVQLTAREVKDPVWPYVLAAAPSASAQPQGKARDITEAVREYVEDYEMVGETEDGRDACYTPNEKERLLIEDAIHGFLADDGFQRLQASAQEPQGEAQQPALTDDDLKELAYSAHAEAMSFGLDVDVFVRYFHKVAKQAQQQESRTPCTHWWPTPEHSLFAVFDGQWRCRGCGALKDTGASKEVNDE